MNHEMIEPKVTAIMNELVTTKKQYKIDSMSGNFYSQNDIVDVLRSTLTTLPEPGIDLNEVEKLVQLIAMKEANLLEFPNEDKMATDPRGYACKNIADMLRCKIGYTLSHLEAKEGRG